MIGAMGLPQVPYKGEASSFMSNWEKYLDSRQTIAKSALFPWRQQLIKVGVWYHCWTAAQRCERLRLKHTKSFKDAIMLCNNRLACEAWASLFVGPYKLPDASRKITPDWLDGGILSAKVKVMLQQFVESLKYFRFALWLILLVFKDSSAQCHPQGQLQILVSDFQITLQLLKFDKNVPFCPVNHASWLSSSQ